MAKMNIEEARHEMQIKLEKYEISRICEELLYNIGMFMTINGAGVPIWPIKCYYENVARTNCRG